MKVRITVTERVTYTDTVDMPAKEFRRLQKALDDATFRGRKEVEEEIASKIKRTDENWLDSDLESADIEKDAA